MKLFKVYHLLPMFMAIMLFMPSSIFAMGEKKYEKTYSLDRDGKVNLKNISGDIVVHSWNKSEIKIKATKVARHEKDLDDVFIDVTKTNGNIRIMNRHMKSSKLLRSTNVSINYKLLIPDNAQLKVASVSGNVEIQDIGGTIEVNTVRGNIKISAAKDGVRSKTVSGNIFMAKIVGKADIKTTSGDINIEGIRGSVEVETVSGDVDLKAFSQSEEIEVETISGDISLHGSLISDGNYELDSHSGKIKIAVPPDSSFEFEIKTSNGNIKCDLDYKASGKINPKRIEGVVGKGDADLNISTFSGDIKISIRENQ